MDRKIVQNPDSNIISGITPSHFTPSPPPPRSPIFGTVRRTRDQFGSGLMSGKSWVEPRSWLGWSGQFNTRFGWFDNRCSSFHQWLLWLSMCSIKFFFGLKNRVNTAFLLVHRVPSSHWSVKSWLFTGQNVINPYWQIQEEHFQFFQTFSSPGQTDFLEISSIFFEISIFGSWARRIFGKLIQANFVTAFTVFEYRVMSRTVFGKTHPYSVRGLDEFSKNRYSLYPEKFANKGHSHWSVRTDFWLDKMWFRMVTLEWFIKSGMIIWFRDICKKWKYEFWEKFKNKKSGFRRENFKMENFSEWNTNCFMKMLSRDERLCKETPPTQNFDNMKRLETLLSKS